MQVSLVHSAAVPEAVALVVVVASVVASAAAIEVASAVVVVDIPTGPAVTSPAKTCTRTTPDLILVMAGSAWIAMEEDMAVVLAVVTTCQVVATNMNQANKSWFAM